MKTFTTICFFGVLAVASCETYTDKFDNINVKEMLANDRLFNRQFMCIMDNGPCTAEGAEVRKNLREAFETDCAKCTAAQKRAAKDIISHLINKKPDMWNELCDKFDINRGKYEKELREIKH